LFSPQPNTSESDVRARVWFSPHATSTTKFPSISPFLTWKGLSTI
jgi:hypothetical protein